MFHRLHRVPVSRPRPGRAASVLRALVPVQGAAIAALLAAAPLLRAEPVADITYDSIAGQVRARNPDLDAARLAIDEATGRMRNAGRLEHPELQVAPRYNTTSSERGLEIGLSQKFPVTSRLKLEKNLGATEVESARQEIREVENQLIGRARAALVRVLAARQRKDLLEQQARLSAELADFIAAAAERGEASTLEAGQARLVAVALRRRDHARGEIAVAPGALEGGRLLRGLTPESLRELLDERLSAPPETPAEAAAAGSESVVTTASEEPHADSVEAISADAARPAA